jgi:predicted nucleotidyltransferase
MARISPVIKKRATQALQILAAHAKVCAAYVFGSHVEGNPGTYSDIDLAVFVDDVEGWDIFRRAEVTALVQRRVGDDIELHYFPAQALESPDPASFAAYILDHGLPIQETNDKTEDSR